MDFLLSIRLLCCIFLLAKACDSTITCTSSPKCSLSSSEIGFPFRVDFNLFCSENRTMIHFPTYGDLVVKSISYETRRLSLLDPKNCVHEVFLNLNLSLAPFSYYYDLKHYKYINCSSKLVSSFEQVPCLSGTKDHVYIVELSSSIPFSCGYVKSVEIPFSYSPYLSDSSFGLGLTWNPIGLDEESSCKVGILCDRGRLEKSLKVSAIIACIFIVGMLFYATLSRSHEDFNEMEVNEAFGHQLEIQELLGEYNMEI